MPIWFGLLNVNVRKVDILVTVLKNPLLITYNSPCLERLNFKVFWFTFFSGQRKVEADSGDHARGHDVAVVAGGLQDDDGGGQRDQTESHDKDGFSQSKFRYIRQEVTTMFNHHSIGNSDKKLQQKCISSIKA